MAHERPERVYKARAKLEIATSELLGQMRAAYALGLNKLADRLNVEVERFGQAGQELYKCWSEEQDEHLATTRQGTCNMINGMLTATKLPTTVFCVQQRTGLPLMTVEIVTCTRTFEDAASFIAHREGRDAISWTHHDSHGRSWTWGDYRITEQELS